MKIPLIVDAHLDLAYNAINYKRNYLHSALRTRAQEQGTPEQAENGKCTVGYPDLMRGRVGLVFGTVYVSPAMDGMTGAPPKYRTAEEAHAQAMAQLDYYHRLADQESRIRLVTSRQDLDAVTQGWLSDKRSDKNPHRHIGIVPLMEGADPIREPKELERWVERGIRIVGPAWSQTRYSGGTGAPGGLTKIGFELLDVMASYGVILDVSHMAEKALFEALEHFGGQHVIASHSNPKKITPTDRHLPDEAIEIIAQRKGVIGVVLYNRFLKHDWTKRDAKHLVTLDHIVRCIDYICQLTGSAEHVGIGTDFDGGFGSESIPAELDTARDLYRVGDELTRRGYSDAHVAQVMYGNWLRVLQSALK